ncbi:MAG: response regulator [Candidatus Ryanbacteria bacterium]|nr:response regulator [Candidatus Ryanbacteria bacterium]
MTTDDSSMPIASMLKRNEMKILVVEDDKFLRGLLVEKIKHEGFTVTEAINADEAFAAVHKNPPHIILLDLILPGKGGFEILTELKAQHDYASIPIIIISNLGSRDDVDQAMKLGAAEFMIKAHHTPQEIVETIKKVLEANYIGK